MTCCHNTLLCFTTKIFELSIDFRCLVGITFWRAVIIHCYAILLRYLNYQLITAACGDAQQCMKIYITKYEVKLKRLWSIYVSNCTLQLDNFCNHVLIVSIHCLFHVNFLCAAYIKPGDTTLTSRETSLECIVKDLGYCTCGCSGEFSVCSCVVIVLFGARFVIGRAKVFCTFVFWWVHLMLLVSYYM